MTLFKCQCCGITYIVDKDIEGPECCSECLNSIFNYKLKERPNEPKNNLQTDLLAD